MTEQEKLQQDITFAQNRLQAKVAALPKLEKSDLPEHISKYIVMVSRMREH